MNIRQRKEIHSALVFSLYGKTQIRAAQPLECRISHAHSQLILCQYRNGGKNQKSTPRKLAGCRNPFDSRFFYHPDYTVGSGITPDQRKTAVAGLCQRHLPPVRNHTSPRRIFFLFGTIIYLLFSDFKLFPEKILFQKTVPHRALFVDMYFADLTAVSDKISVPAFRKRFNTQRSIEPAPKATARNICDLFGVVLCFKNKK